MGDSRLEKTELFRQVSNGIYIPVEDTESHLTLT